MASSRSWLIRPGATPISHPDSPPARRPAEAGPVAVAAAFAWLSSAAAPIPALAQEADAGEDGRSKPTHEFRREGVVLRLTPLRIDPVAAFLIGRGFPTPQASRYARTCVIRLVLANESPAAITYDLRHWRVQRPDGANGHLATREDWLPRWREAGISGPPLVGFEWSQMPPRQELHEGDTALGMVSAGLSPGARFDLRVEWTAAGRTRHETLKAIACAPSS